ncbi:hypothetical protein [Leucobacter musarum]|uniref:hypothetical protein n=1 Tax=Leucobacter musarum TaxID=1930747 RepID=UPI000B322D95|nr:hypothetical protein [Leucobacter musarum]
MSGVVTPTLTLGGTPEHRFMCSRAGCRDAAAFAILWRNPKIHTPERRKTWLACTEHRQVLHDFLEARGFPLDVRTVEELDD